jgi:hypothetical protein
MYILKLLSKIFCRCLLSPSGLSCTLSLKFFCWFFFWLGNLFIGKNSILKLATNTVSGSICPFISNNVCLVKLGVPMFGTYLFTITIFLDRLFPLIICGDFFSFLTNFCLKSVLSNISYQIWI